MSASLEIGAAPVVGDAEFAFFRDLIRTRTGIALKDCKRSLVAARLGRRLRALGLGSYRAYRMLLETSDPSGGELGLMINCITTNKTSFFREEAHFAVLARSIAAAGRAGQEIYRIWSAACSTGEEPYSIAIAALETCRTMEIRILASDIDTDVLAKGRDAVYPMEALEGMDSQVIHRYFLRGCAENQGRVQVKPIVRGLVTFRHINLIAESWPIQTRFDAIFCRNVIIYFGRDTQKRMFERMADYLAPGGLLFVGHAESLFWLNGLFAPAGDSVYRVRQPMP
jgi:chemotaxis protein methyltransferase CheR